MPDKVVSRENLKAFREKLDDKYVIEGEYSPSTSVGLSDEADALTPYGPNSGASDQSAFRFQTTGGSSDVGALAYQKKLLGNTVGFNQLVQNGNFESTSGWNATYGSISVSNNTILYTVTTVGNASQNRIANTNLFNAIKDHKYLVIATIKPLTREYTMFFTGYSSQLSKTLMGGQIDTVSLNTTKTIYGIFTSNDTGTCDYRLSFSSDNKALNDAIEVRNYMLIDLTLLGKEYSTVLEFNRDYPLPYYSYNAGQLFSCKTNKVRNVGYNAFDGVLEGGGIYSGTGTNNNSSSALSNSTRSKNYIKVIQGQTYSFEYQVNETAYLFYYDETFQYIGYVKVLNNQTIGSKVLPDNCSYVKFEVENNNLSAKIAFHLTWDGSRTGYEPYQVNEYAMPDIELRSAGSVQDELTPDGTLTRKVGTYTFTGQESWNIFDSDYDFFYLTITTLMPNAKNNGSLLIIGLTNRGVSGTDSTDNVIALSSSTLLRARHTSTPTVAEFNQFLAGKTIIYELDTPTPEQNDAYKYQEVQQVDDFGTQEALSSITESASTPIVPQGFDFFYPVDYKAFLDSLGGRDDIEYDANQIVSQTELASAVAFKELSSSYIGAITSSEVVAGEFYKNNIAITGGLSNAKYVIAVMSNGNKYPMIITSSLLVTYSGTSWQASNLTVTKIYYKE